MIVIDKLKLPHQSYRYASGKLNYARLEAEIEQIMFLWGRMDEKSICNFFKDVVLLLQGDGVETPEPKDLESQAQPIRTRKAKAIADKVESESSKMAEELQPDSQSQVEDLKAQEQPEILSSEESLAELDKIFEEK